MENISHNKANYLQKLGFNLDVKKSKDVLGKDEVKAADILNQKSDSRINKMSDVFPQSGQNNGDILSWFWGIFFTDIFI